VGSVFRLAGDSLRGRPVELGQTNRSSRRPWFSRYFTGSRSTEMDVSIKYCVQWEYRPKAAGLADAIQKHCGIRPRLIEGNGGVFDVRVDGRLIYSKADTGRFPEHREVLDALDNCSAW